MAGKHAGAIQKPTHLPNVSARQWEGRGGVGEVSFGKGSTEGSGGVIVGASGIPDSGECAKPFAGLVGGVSDLRREPTPWTLPYYYSSVMLMLIADASPLTLT